MKSLGKGKMSDLKDCCGVVIVGIRVGENFKKDHFTIITLNVPDKRIKYNKGRKEQTCQQKT